MKVDENTLYSEFEVFEKCLTQESLQELKRAAEEKYGSMYNLTIDQFFGISNGDFSVLGDMTNPTVLQVYWQKRFEDFCVEFGHMCERLSIKDPSREYLHNGCVDISGLEGILIFTREYFGLPSFIAAGRRTMGEYITARKDKYNAARVQRNFEEEQKRKLKLRKK